MQVFLRLFNHERSKIVAACDKDLIGLDLAKGRLRMKVRREFYGSTLYTIEDAIALIRDADIVNLVGQKIVDAVVDAGLVHSEAVIKVGHIPHVQIVRIRH